MSVPVIKSVLVNVSGVRTYFDFLLPGGQYLEPGDSWEYWGDVFDWMRHSGDNGNRTKKARALEHCINEGLIEVRQYTDPVFFDETSGLSKIMLVDDSNLVLRDSSAGVQQEADIIIGGTQNGAPPPSQDEDFVLDGSENTAYWFSGTGGAEPVGDETGTGAVNWDFSGNVGDNIVLDQDQSGEYAMRAGAGGQNLILDPENQLVNGDAPSLSFWMKYVSPITSYGSKIILDWTLGGGGLYLQRPAIGAGTWRIGIGGRGFDVNAAVDIETWYHMAFGQLLDGTYYYRVKNGETGAVTEEQLLPTDNLGGPLKDYSFAGGSNGLLRVTPGSNGGDLLIDDFRTFKTDPTDLEKLSSKRGGAS